ncbi:bifunctional adenosylcobinamide kinase/adenosylcobinamide-phosphate guanylyltransferase [Lachnospiraceae bacterium ZAX-1]
MILIIGAAASGKREYVRALGYTDADMANAILDKRPVIYNLQDFIYQSPFLDSNILLSMLLKKEVVICNEVGSGIIPLEHAQRELRETTGRMCILLAKRAERVIRLICGIPTVIKE